MSYDGLIETREIGDYRIKIYYDQDAECPVTAWDLGGLYIFENLERGSYRLCSCCDWKEWVHDLRYKTMTDILQRMAAEVIEQKDLIAYIKAGKIKGLRFVYNPSTHLWELQWQRQWGADKGVWDTAEEIEPSDLKLADVREEIVEHLEEDDLYDLIRECAKDFVIQAWGSSGYSQGDSIRGYGYMTKEQFDKRVGFSKNHYKTWQEQALAIIDAETNEIGMWAWGDVKGFVLEKKVPFKKVYDDDDHEDVETFEWELVESIWGYYMETEDLIKEVISGFIPNEPTAIAI